MAINPDRPDIERPSWIWRAPRWGMCLMALVIAVLAAGAVAIAGPTAVSSDPDWIGPSPFPLSPGDQDKTRRPDIAINSADQVAVVWSDLRSTETQRDIYATTYLNTWSGPQVVTTTQDHDSINPNLLAVGDRFFAAWVELNGNKVLVAELGSGEISSVDSAQAPVDAWPSLAAADGRLHMVFAADSAGIPDLYYTSRPLASASWAPLVRIYTAPPGELGAWWPAMAAGPDGQTLHLVWEESTLTTKSIKYISATVSGGSTSWSTTPTTLSPGIPQSIRPDIAVDADGNVHVVWPEVVGVYGVDYDEQYVRYTRLDAGSGTWLDSQRIDPEHVEANGIAPAYNSAHVATWKDDESGQITVCAAWHGFRSGFQIPEAEEALLTCSLDGGDTWLKTQNVSRSTTSAGTEVSIRPVIAFDSSGDIHIAWQEYSGGGSVRYDYEIYYISGGPGAGPVYLPLVLRNYP